MLDLTFGEQVKIILSRKGMTIKELAETIEARTGKKMSRQNLTQRLGRDNFQEQDMRMIAEILGCPFQLSILGESIPIERTHNNSEEESARISPAEARHGKNRVSDVGEQKDGELPVMAHERDITIGELVDIHEELDALMENGAILAEEERGAEYSGEAQGEAYSMPEEELAAVAQTEVPGEEPEENYAVPEAISEENRAVPKEISEESYIVSEEGHIEDIYGGMPEAIPQEKYAVSEEGRIEDMRDEMSEESQEGIAALEETGEAETREENMAVRTEEKKEEPEQKEPEKKARGWRAYLMRRKKKQEPARQEEHHAAERPEDIERKEPEEHAYTAEDSVQEGYAQSEYAQSEYAQTDHTPLEYGADDNTEGYVTEGYPEEGDLQEEYVSEGYNAEAYGQEQEILEEEEDLVNGDVNPYTGREYQSNSVRMHPSRIGYVQVYDRSIHAWTDMTEWAFLGYQERKKVLLGKDYDPPIYLD